MDTTTTTTTNRLEIAHNEVSRVNYEIIELRGLIEVKVNEETLTYKWETDNDYPDIRDIYFIRDQEEWPENLKGEPYALLKGEEYWNYKEKERAWQEEHAIEKYLTDEELEEVADQICADIEDELGEEPWNWER